MTDRTSTGIDQNTAALLSYIFTWVSGLVFFLLEKENKYVRFHALQSILLGISLIIISVLLVIIMQVLNYIPLLGPFLRSVLGLAYFAAYFVVIIMAMLKAFQGERYKFPIIGDIAERNV